MNQITETLRKCLSEKTVNKIICTSKKTIRYVYDCIVYYGDIISTWE